MSVKTKNGAARCVRCGHYFGQEPSHNSNDATHTGDYCKKCQAFMNVNVPKGVEEGGTMSGDDPNLAELM